MGLNGANISLGGGDSPKTEQRDSGRVFKDEHVSGNGGWWYQGVMVVGKPGYLSGFGRGVDLIFDERFGRNRQRRQSDN